MKQESHSFAYYYAKQVLRRRTPKWDPLVGLVCGLAFLSLSFMRGKFELRSFAVPVLMLYGAVHSWVERGKQEAFQEAESAIDEMRSSNDA